MKMKALKRILSMLMTVLMLAGTFSMMFTHVEAADTQVTSPKTYSSAANGDKLLDVDFTQHFTAVDDTSTAFTTNGTKYNSSGTAVSTATNAWRKSLVASPSVATSNELKIEYADTTTDATDHRYIGYIPAYDLDNKTVTMEFEYFRSSGIKSKFYFGKGSFIYGTDTDDIVSGGTDADMPNLGLEVKAGTAGYRLMRQSAAITAGVTTAKSGIVTSNGEQSTTFKVILKGGTKVTKTLYEGKECQTANVERWTGSIIPVSYAIVEITSSGSVINVVSGTFYQPSGIGIVFGIGEYDALASGAYYGVRNLAIYKGCTTCVDADKDHSCDFCSKAVGTHLEPANSHTCAYCGKAAGTCFDADPVDHKCDKCGAAYGTHTIATGKHVCAHCGKTHYVDWTSTHTTDDTANIFSATTDTITCNSKANDDIYYRVDSLASYTIPGNVYEVDYWIEQTSFSYRIGFQPVSAPSVTGSGTTVRIGWTTCVVGKNPTPSNNDYMCLLENGSLKNTSQAVEAPRDIDTSNNNRQHFKIKVDGINNNMTLYVKYNGEFVEADSVAVDFSNSTAKYLRPTFFIYDAIPSGEKVTIGGVTVTKLCVDTNSDHICDYDGCGGKVGECSDSDTDSDHICDLGCGSVASDCYDGSVIDHKCELCGAKIRSLCDDGSTVDHKCDVCGTRMISECVDNKKANGSAGKDHLCDVCGVAIGSLLDLTGVSTISGYASQAGTLVDSGLGYIKIYNKTIANGDMYGKDTGKLIKNHKYEITYTINKGVANQSRITMNFLYGSYLRSDGVTRAGQLGWVIGTDGRISKASGYAINEESNGNYDWKIVDRDIDTSSDNEQQFKVVIDGFGCQLLLYVMKNGEWVECEDLSIPFTIADNATLIPGFGTYDAVTGDNYIRMSDVTLHELCGYNDSHICTVCGAKVSSYVDFRTERDDWAYENWSTEIVERESGSIKVSNKDTAGGGFYGIKTNYEVPGNVYEITYTVKIPSMTSTGARARMSFVNGTFHLANSGDAKGEIGWILYRSSDKSGAGLNYITPTATNNIKHNDAFEAIRDIDTANDNEQKFKVIVDGINYTMTLYVVRNGDYFWVATQSFSINGADTKLRVLTGSYDAITGDNYIELSDVLITRGCSVTKGDTTHKCSICGKTCGTHSTGHSCLICMKATSCSDGDSDHLCDTCGLRLSNCAAASGKHTCSTCGAILSMCDDTNLDHKCDRCSVVLHPCYDTKGDGDHKCDWCNKTELDTYACADNDKDHRCDDCYKTGFGTHEDGTPVDGKCEYCGKFADHTCVDEPDDGDHECDYEICVGIENACVDSNKDHVCDNDSACEVYSSGETRTRITIATISVITVASGPIHLFQSTWYGRRCLLPLKKPIGMLQRTPTATAAGRSPRTAVR